MVRKFRRRGGRNFSGPGRPCAKLRGQARKSVDGNLAHALYPSGASTLQGGAMIRSGIAALMLCLSVAGSAAAQDLKAKGAQIFVDQKCTLCHSIAGKGNAKGSLDDVGAKLSAADIRAW